MSIHHAAAMPSVPRGVKFKSYNHSSTTFFFRASCLVVLLARYQCSLVATVAANQYGECYRHMYAADQAGGNPDSFLSRTEFQNSVRGITFGAITTLSAPLEAVFDLYENGSGAIWVSGVDDNADGVSADPERTVFVSQVCDDVYKAILTSLGKTPNYESCKLWMSLGDRVTGAKDDRLEKNREYAVFANRMTGSEDLYTNDATFTTLPSAVQLVFGDFENPDDLGMINITGAWPTLGQSVETTQHLKLENLCRQIMVAIEAGKVDLPMPTPVPFPGTSPPPATAPPSPGVEEPIDFSFETCLSTMVLSDTIVDNILRQPEYVDFLNRLTDDRYPNARFKNLPFLLQQVYAQKASDDATDGVSIEGARNESSNRTPETQSALETFCNATKLALNGIGTPFNTAPTGVSSSTMAPPPPGIYFIPFADCTLAMATSEIGEPTNSLNQPEYVLFLNKVTSFQFFRDVDYNDLPKPLVDNYDAYNDDERQGIPIDGSFPGRSRTPEQSNKLLTICLATSAAIGQAINATTLPPGTTLAPPTTTTAPTGQPNNAGAVTVFNAFVVSNTAGLGVTELKTPNLSSQLLRGYSNFVSMVVDDLVNDGSSSRGGTRRPIRRKLIRSGRKLPWTGFVPDSASLYEIDEYPCPESVANIKVAACHVVFGSFNASFVNEANTVALAASLSQWIQNAVMSVDGGGLGSFLNSTGLVVEGVPSNGIVRPVDTIPTSAPTISVDTKSTEDDDALSTGILVGIIVSGAVLCFCCCVGVILWRSNGERYRLARDPSQAQILDDNDEVDFSEGSKGFVKQESALPIRNSLRRAPSGELPKICGPSAKLSNSVGNFVKLSSTRVESPAVERQIGEPESHVSSGRDQFSPAQEQQQAAAGTSSVSESNGVGKSMNVFDRRQVIASPKAGDSSQPPEGSGESEWERPASPDSVRAKWASAVFEAKQGDDASVKNENDKIRQKDRAVEKKTEVFEDEIISGEDDVDDGVDYADDSTDDDDVEESESDTYKGDGNSIASHSHNSGREEKSVGTVRMFDSMIDKGDWDGVINNAKKLQAKNDDADSYVQPKGATLGHTPTKTDTEDEESESEEEEFDPEDEGSDEDEEESEEEEESKFDDEGEETTLFTAPGSRSSNNTSSGVSHNTSEDEVKTKEAYRAKVAELISKVVPNEKNNVDTMMSQFQGREEELIQTLENMYQRSSRVRGSGTEHSTGASASSDMADDIEHSNSEFSYQDEAGSGLESNILGDDDDVGESDNNSVSEEGHNDDNNHEDEEKPEGVSSEAASSAGDDDEDESSGSSRNEGDSGYGDDEPSESTRSDDYGYKNSHPKTSTRYNDEEEG